MTDQLIHTPGPDLTQFQIAKLAELYTGGQVKFRLPAFSTLESLRVVKSGLIITYVRQYVVEGTKRDTCRKIERITLVYGMAVDEAGAFKWTRTLDPIRQKLDAAHWSHIKFGDGGQDFSDHSEHCFDPACPRIECMQEGL